MTIVIDTLRPYVDSKSEWTGAPTEATVMWNKLNKTKKEGEAEPEATPLVKTKAATKTCGVKLRKVSSEAYKLPAGVTLLAIRVYWNLKSGTATAAKAVGLETAGTLAAIAAAMLKTDVTTTQHWAKSTATSATTGWAETKTKLEEGMDCQVVLKSKEVAPAEHEGYEIYVEIEYETASEAPAEEVMLV